MVNWRRIESWLMEDEILIAHAAVKVSCAIVFVSMMFVWVILCVYSCV